MQALQMFYESRSHQLLPVANATEAATLIKSGSVAGYQVLTHKHGDINVYYVNDAHINDSNFAETAVLIDAAPNSDVKKQVESITAGWIRTPEELTSYFERAIVEPCEMGIADLTIGQFAKDKTARFQCGCCGNSFSSNAKYQQQFDQDSGYGICKPCERYYK